MFEYLNYGTLGFLGFIGLSAFVVNYNSKKSPVGFYTIILILSGLIFYDSYSKHSSAVQNISDFKSKKVVLKCKSGGGLYASADTYRVSLDDGWYVDKDYFIKESFMVRANKCERW